MATLAQQLEQLKLQQEELEKKIQEEEERKKKLNNEASIKRLESLVEPITEFLDKQRNHLNQTTKNPCETYDNQNRVFCADGWQLRPKLESSSIRQKFENENIQETFIEDMDIAYTVKEEGLNTVTILEREKIYVTLIGILKKQDEKITKLAESIDNLQFYKNKVLEDTDLRSNKMTFNTKYEISAELANFLGKTNRQVSRTQVTREINAYIRNNNLQDSVNGRRILADLKLKELLKLKPNDELTYFNLQRYITPHFVKN